MAIEGGEYTPPKGVQHAIRAVRAGQLAVALTYFFGEQATSALRWPPPHAVRQLMEQPMLTLGSVFGLDAFAQTLKSINAFEITYNGRKLHSKLATGRMPTPQEVVQQLAAIRAGEEVADAPRVRISS